jgi:hypothetical protein
VRWRRRQGHEGSAAEGAIVPWCSNHGMMRWTHQLLRRVHPWPQGDGASPGIVEGGPCKGVASPAVVVGTVTVVDFSYHTLALTLAFAAIVGGGDRG